MLHRALLALSLLFVPAVASAQGSAPPPLPPSIEAEIGLPGAGPARFLNVTVEMSGLPWSIEGCVSSAAGACSATTRIVLDEAARRELVQRIAAIRAMPRCGPDAFTPGDPAYTLTTPTDTWRGHLPRDASQVTSRTTGACAAPTALAWWIVHRFGVPGLTAPQGCAASRPASRSNTEVAKHRGDPAPTPSRR